MPRILHVVVVPRLERQCLIFAARAEPESKIFPWVWVTKGPNPCLPREIYGYDASTDGAPDSTLIPALSPPVFRAASKIQL